MYTGWDDEQQRKIDTVDKLNADMQGDEIGMMEKVLESNKRLLAALQAHSRVDELTAEVERWKDAAVTIGQQLDAANGCIAELESAQRWISVDERLPEVAQWCLVYGKHLNATPHIRNQIVTSMRLEPGSSGTVAWWIRESKITSLLKRQHVTHWMPLPPPPSTTE